MDPTPGNGTRRSSPWRRVAIASLISFVLMWPLLAGVKRLAAYGPVAAGCGEHDGLVIATDIDVSPDSQRRALIEKWNALLAKWNSGKPRDQRATLVEVSRSTDETRSQLAAALESGSCAYDVVLADVAWVPEYIQRGFLSKLDDSWLPNSNDFFHDVLETGQSANGVQYAIPWYTDAGLLYVQNGDPSRITWNDLLDHGYLSQLKNYEGLTVNALEVVWNTQKDPVPILSGRIDGVDVKTAQVILRGLHRLAGEPGLPGLRTYAEDDSFNAFVRSGKTPMRNWPYAFRELTANPRLRDHFKVGNLPGSGLSVLGGWDLAISANSRHKAEAGALIKTMTSTENERALFVCGGFTPTRGSAFTDLDPLRLCNAGNKFRADELPSREQFSQFSDTVKVAVRSAAPRPVTPYYAQFSETFRGCVTLVLNGRPPTPARLAKALTDALHGRNGSCG